MLSAREDVICLPETFFPHMLDYITADEWLDKRWVAALFVASCSDGCPLTLEESAKCVRDTHKETLESIAAEVACKEGRDPTTIQAAVWKATRLIGSNQSIRAIGGRAVILHRPRLNVFESQFRVPFGSHNHNPSRFALFAASYDAAFSKYKNIATMHVEYARIPEVLDEVFSWIGSVCANAATTTGSVKSMSGGRAWHSQIHKPFRNDDDQKISNLSNTLIHRFNITQSLLQLLPPVGALARHLADRRQASELKKKASQILSKYTP
jgi:hypothetical protein